MSTLWFSKKWNRFWFKNVSPYPLTTFRAGIGLAFLLFWISYGRELQMWYGPDGIAVVSATKAAQQARFSLLNILPRNEASLWLVYLIALIGSLGLVTGIRPRCSAFLAWIGALSLNQMASVSFYGGKSVLQISAFLLIFADSGRALSTDTARPAQKLVSAWPLRLLQIQFSVIWVAAGLNKLLTPVWRSGEAVLYALQLSERRGPVPLFLLQNGHSIRAMTWGTIGIELGCGILLWPRVTRRTARGILLTFHILVAIATKIFLFQFVMCVGLLLFCKKNEKELILEHQT